MTTCPECGREIPEGAGGCAACASGPADATQAPTSLGTGVGTGSPTDRATGAATRLAPGDTLGSRYEIQAVLGRGAMGTVFKARDRELERTVALKIIRPEMLARPGILERFKREILLASQVTHKNVLRIHDLGEVGDLRFISMNYVEGSDLRTVLRREGPLSVDRALPLVRQIAEALSAAHEAGVVHRDLKPQNILTDTEGNAYIADFGISRSLETGGTMTEAGDILGTIDYMSPEQAKGERPDHRGDIYSFGVILYEIFTGALPFQGRDALSVMMRRVHQDAPAVRQARPDLPPWVSAIVARALQRDPADRYQSVADLRRDFERRRVAIAWRRRIRRRLPIVAAGLVVIAALAAGLYFLAMRPSAAGVPRASLVILAFQNATGDPRYDWARAGLPSLLSSDLIQAKGLRLVGEDRVRGVLESLRLPETEDPGPANVRRIAALTGADSILTGRLLKIADRLRIDASLQRGGEKASPAPPLVVDGKGDDTIFAMVDELTQRIRAELGVESGWMEPTRGAADLSTRSVEALAAYGDALALARTGRQMDAAARLEAALEKDPGFSMARALLAETYSRLGYADKAAAEAGKAAGGLAASSPYEAARIRAIVARLEGNLEAAEKACRSLTEIAPNNAEAFLDLALIQEERGDLRHALDSLRRVVALDSKHPAARFALGRVQHRLGNPTEALQELSAALALHNETGDDEGKATVLQGFGTVYLDVGSYDDALDHYQGALEIRRQIGDRRGIWKCLQGISTVHMRRGRNEDAIAAGEEALAVARDMGDRAGLASMHSQVGEAYQSAGKSEVALKSYQESLKILREMNDPGRLARTLNNLGSVNAVLGRYVEALFFLKEALEKRREIGDKTEIVTSLIDIGLVEQAQGRYEEALLYYTEGLALAKETNSKGGMVVLLQNLATLHEEQGEYGPALSLLADAEVLARASKSEPMIAYCLICVGGTRRRLGDFAGAEAALVEALGLAKTTGDSLLLAETLTNQAALALARDDGKSAAAVAREAMEVAESSGDQRLHLLARLQAGRAAGSVRDLDLVLKDAESAGLIPIATATRLALTQVELAAGRPLEASRHAEQGGGSAASQGQRDLLFQARWLRGKCLIAQKDMAAAADQFSAALTPLEEIRRGLKEPLLGIFLARPETVMFGEDAGEAYRATGRTTDVERLQRLLAP